MVTPLKRIQVLFCLFCFSCQSLAAQSPAVAIDSSAFKLGKDLHTKAINIYNTHRDSALIFLEKAAEQYKRAHADEAYIEELLILTTTLHGNKKFEKYFYYAQFTADEIKAIKGQEDLTYAKALNNLMSHYYMRGNYTKAISMLERALVILEKNQVAPALILQNYHNQASNYIRIGEYTKALLFQEKAYQLLKEDSLQTNNHGELARSLNSMGEVYQKTDQLEMAALQYKKSLALWKGKKLPSKNATTNKRVIRALLESSKIALRQEDYEKAAQLVRKALRYQKGKVLFRKSYSYELLGDIKMAKDQKQQALAAYEKSKELAEADFSTSKLPNFARKFLRIAEVQFALAQYQESLDNCQKGLSILSPSFNGGNIFDNPDKKDLLSDLYVLDFLQLKGKLMEQLFLSTTDIKQLSGAMSAYRRGIEIISQIRKAVVTPASKNQLAEHTSPIYEGAIRSAYQLFQETQEQQYLEMAFSYAESNKALSLLEAMNEQLAKGLKGLPDSLLEQEKQLRLDIVFYEKKILKAGASKPVAKDENLEKWKDQLFQLNKQLQRITSAFENDYPHFYDLKYQEERIDLNVLRKRLLDNNQAVIEYFIGKEQLYGFLVTSEDIRIFTSPFTAANIQDIEQLRQVISEIPPTAEIKANYQQYLSAASNLYEQLMKPAIDQLPAAIQSLMIIPDGQLNYVPFELLLMEKTTGDNFSFSPTQLEYVLEKYQISYDYSTIFFCKNLQKERPTHKRNFVGFAPSFQQLPSSGTTRSCLASELYNLDCNQEEVASINQLIKGQVLLDKAAQKGKFEELLLSSRILHLATHACIDDNNAINSKIFLTDDFVSGSDLLNSQTNAELVVLSACNTGAGQLVKGEGTMSLARGFIQAGSASCVLSRWSVDDCATSDIMLHFYKQLKAGKARHDALRLSKLEYLKQADKFHQHPYYWAAFSIYGETTKMDLSQPFDKRWLFLLLGLVIIGGLLAVGNFR